MSVLRLQQENPSQMLSDQGYRHLQATCVAAAREPRHQKRNRACCCHLDDSANGPKGDRDNSSGELPVCTSCSKLLDSFLSRPASLPAHMRCMCSVGLRTCFCE